MKIKLAFVLMGMVASGQMQSEPITVLSTSIAVCKMGAGALCTGILFREAAKTELGSKVHKLLVDTVAKRWQKQISANSSEQIGQKMYGMLPEQIVNSAIIKRLQDLLAKREVAFESVRVHTEKARDFVYNKTMSGAVNRAGSVDTAGATYVQNNAHIKNEGLFSKTVINDPNLVKDYWQAYADNKFWQGTFVGGCVTGYFMSGKKERSDKN